MTLIATETRAFDQLRARCAGTVVEPRDETWNEARQAWQLLFDQQPAAVVFPADADDVVEAVRFARDSGLRVAVQGTGHNAPAYGELGDDTLLVRTSTMRGVKIDPATRRARAQAGALWEDVVMPASPMGLAALHGSSPDVGVAGYSLGGGVGWLARKHGLACNSLTAVELVMADGERVRADAAHEPELFWGLRGGGGNFGAVTALEFELYPLESVYAGWLIWPWEQSEQVLPRWAEWVETVPDDVTSVGRILQLPDLPMIPEPIRGRQIVVVEAAYLGDEAGGAELLRPLRELAPEIDTFAAVPPAGLARLHADPEGPTPAVVDHVLIDELPAAAVDALLATAGPDSCSPLVSVEIRHLGGAVGTPAVGAGALSHVDAAFMEIAVGMPMDAESAVTCEQQTAAIAKGLAPWSSGRSYLNLAERPTDTRTAYPADTYQRLQALKTHTDPDGVFRANHEIQPDA
jgi:FAD/FMN-containing dehydrogenase